MSTYTELHCHSYFSLLDGASSPEALVDETARLGMTALALTDHHSLAGAVRFSVAARRTGIQAIFGAEIAVIDDGMACHLTLLTENQDGYANLCRLLTTAHLRPGEDDGWPGKVEPWLTWDHLVQHRQGLLVLSGCRRGPVAAALLRKDETAAQQAARQLIDCFGREAVWVEVQHHARPQDDRLVAELAAVAAALDLPLVATGNVHHATQDGNRLRDALISVRHNQTLSDARRAGHLPPNSNQFLRTPAFMARRFANYPVALLATQTIAERCHVSLDFADRPHCRLPHFIETEGLSEFAYLYQLCHRNFAWRYPQLSPAVLKQLAHELDVIERAGLAGYFLIVWDIVRFARDAGIRCQGRGSAANSIVAYLLGITSIDPLQHNLLFERFLAAPPDQDRLLRGVDNYTMPDIDLDFAADRREEVIQYVYRKYGAAHTAMVCNVVTYQARSALRDLAKVLDFPAPVIDRLAKGLDTHSCREAAAQLRQTVDEGRKTMPLKTAGEGRRMLPPQTNDDGRPTTDDGQHTADDVQPAVRNPQLAIRNPPFALPSPQSPITSHQSPLLLLADLMDQIDGCPRHLSIHTGGMLITGLPLNDVVPLERASMPGRVVCQWDKDSVEDAGLIKIDLLGLRTLGMITEALTWIEQQGATPPDLDALPLDDPEIYRMLQRADTIGAFQVESRAQGQMLPRLKPTRFEDMVVEVAIVRPGPIQGGAVHPYLRRRSGEEAVDYAHPSLAPVLEETLGVLLFQEQAIRVAVVAAGFTPGEADALRRAMSRSRSQEAMNEMERLFLHKAQDRGLDAVTAAAVFAQLAGFAGFGFCKSHAASFALIAYQTLYLKRYHGPAFYCALLNQQPMGFYAPEVIVGDARRHGVDLLPPDIQRSQWKYLLERTDRGRWALRMGLSTIDGLGEAAWLRIETARRDAPFPDLKTFVQRTHLSSAQVENLIRAGALDSLGERRQLLWMLGQLPRHDDDLGLDVPPVAVVLPNLDALESSAWEYELLGLSPAGQVMIHYREALRRAGLLSTAQVKRTRGGQRVQVAGMVVVRQRPSTARGVTFLSLEDEQGLLDVVLQPPVYERYRHTLRQTTLLIITGVVQRADRAVSLLAHHLQALVE